MTFDMSRAWDQAAAMVHKNSRMVGLVAGVFFFLPVAAVLLTMPDFSQDPALNQSAGDPQAMSKMITAVLQEVWGRLLFAMLMQTVGMLALYRLLSDRTRPTVGEALRFGASALLPYIGASLLVQLIQTVAVGLPTRLLQGTPVGATVGLLGLFVTVWLTIRFILTGPVVAIDRQFNPFKAVRRAWQMTAGHATRLLAFFILLIAAAVVLWLVGVLLFSLVFGLMGPEASRFGFVLVTSAAVAGYSALSGAVMVAIHRQLDRPDQPQPSGPVF